MGSELSRRESEAEAGGSEGGPWSCAWLAHDMRIQAELTEVSWVYYLLGMLVWFG
jgi:hypothetical protein